MIRKKEVKGKKAVAAILLPALLAGCLTGCGGMIVETAKPTQIAQQHQEEADATLRPQDDFYGYINKKALKELEINYSEMQLGADYDTQMQVDAQIGEMLKEIVSSAERYEDGSSEQLVKAFYLQMKDYLNGQECGAREHFSELAGEINAAENVADIKEVMSRLTRQGIVPVFGVEVSANFYNSTENILYFPQLTTIAGMDLKEIYDIDSKRQELWHYVTNVLVAASMEPTEAKGIAREFVYAAIDLGRETDFSIPNSADLYSTYTYYTAEQADELLCNLSLGEIAEIFGLEMGEKGCLIQDEKQLAAIDALFCEEHMETLKTWLLCELLSEYRYFLEEDFAFLPRELHVAGYSISELAQEATAMVMTEQVSELYAKYYYTEEMDKQLVRMYEDICSAYDTLIRNADWLSDTMRERLLKKLHNMKFIRGGGKPKAHDPADKELIGEDVFATYRNVKQKKLADLNRKLHTPVDREKCSMDSHVVNAAYSPLNTFTITPAIMQAPYFDVNADYATNMGGLGMVMAHEIGHAFDSNQIAFDENAVYCPQTIPEADKRVLKAQLDKMESYFASFTVLNIYHVDGALTSGENYADKGAMECLMTVVTAPEDRRKLFENYAAIWMQLLEDETVIQRLSEDEHSPNIVRVNAVLSSTPEFYELYDVREGDGMYVPEQDRVSRW